MDDIEALKRELQQTRLAYRSALALARWKSGLLGRTAHELRSPLSSLIGLHQLILADLCETPEEQRDFIDRAHRSARKLLALLDEIITLSKLESGYLPIERRSISLQEFLPDLERVTRLLAANRNLKIEVLPPDSEIALVGDFRWLSHALVLLIDVAIERSERGTIRIAGTSADGETVNISLELPCPASLWQEKLENPRIPLEATPEALSRFDEPLSLSPGLRWEMARTILELLGGRLDYREIAPSGEGETITRIDCSLPRSPGASGIPTGNG